MPAFSLTKPFENIETRAEAAVLALIDHLMPTLSEWRLGEELRNEEREIIDRLESIRSETVEKKASLDVASKSIALEEATTKKMTYLFYGLLAIGVGLLFVFSVAVVVAFAAGYPFMKMRGAKKNLEKLQAEKFSLERSLAELRSEEEQAESRRVEILAELNQRTDGFPEITIADVSFDLQAVSIAGENVLVDMSESHAGSPLRTVDVSELTDGLGSVDEEIQHLSSVPPLLSPAEAGVSDPINHLYGEEQNLQELVGEFTVTLSKLNELKVSIPLVSNASILVKRLHNGELTRVDDNARGVSISSSESIENIRKFLEVFERNKDDGKDIIDSLVSVYGDLEECCRRFATARTNSINLIHRSLTDVLARSTWVNKRFFCPRTIVSPAYLQDLIGINAESAHNLELHDLLDGLQRDDVIRERVSKKPELLEQLATAYESVHDFMGDDFTHHPDGSMNITDRPRHISQQYEESLKQFRLVLNRVLTGSSYPTLNFSAQSQLFFDPEIDEWSSDLNPYVYSTSDVLKYGSLIKTHYDLMIPLWEHLWTEKADFRRSELFRTNEAMINMSEKESEKLIEIGNQFRGDLRTNRENIYLIESELKSKFEEIVGFRDGMHQLGLLSDRAMSQLTDEKLKVLISDSSPLETSHRYETTLGALPNAQAEARGTVFDPIDLVKDPSMLVSVDASEVKPRLIANR